MSAVADRIAKGKNRPDPDQPGGTWSAAPRFTQASFPSRRRCPRSGERRWPIRTRIRAAGNKVAWTATRTVIARAASKTSNRTSSVNRAAAIVGNNASSANNVDHQMLILRERAADWRPFPFILQDAGLHPERTGSIIINASAQPMPSPSWSDRAIPRTGLPSCQRAFPPCPGQSHGRPWQRYALRPGV